MTTPTGETMIDETEYQRLRSILNGQYVGRVVDYACHGDNTTHALCADHAKSFGGNLTVEFAERYGDCDRCRHLHDEYLQAALDEREAARV